MVFCCVTAPRTFCGEVTETNHSLLLTDSMLYAKSPKREGKKTVNKLSEDKLRNVILAFSLQKNLKLVNLLVNVKSNSMTMMARPVTSFVWG